MCPFFNELEEVSGEKVNVAPNVLVNVDVDHNMVVASSKDERPSYVKSVDGSLEAPKKKNMLTERQSLSNNFQDQMKNIQESRVEREAALTKKAPEDGETQQYHRRTAGHCWSKEKLKNLSS